MKKLSLILSFVLITSVAFAQKKSPRKQATGSINGVNVTVDYGSPSVKGRTVWGGLEKYGKVWRAGANENTTVSFDNTVTIGGKSLKAGKYGFFIIPNENGEWVAIFNTKNDGWGAYSYKESEDAVRVKIKPEFTKNNQETLEYSVGKDGIIFNWEKAKLMIPVNSLM